MTEFTVNCLFNEHTQIRLVVLVWFTCWTVLGFVCIKDP